MTLEEFSNQPKAPNNFGIDLKAASEWEKKRMAASEEFAFGTIDSQRQVTENELKTDRLFIDAYKVAARQMYGEMPDGTDEELASKALQFVSDATIPATTFGGSGMLGTYTKFKDAHPEAKQALWYMIDTVDKKDITFNGFQRALLSIGKDPTTYTGVAGGWAFFGKEAEKSASKQMLKEMLFSSAVTGAYTGADEVIRQDLQGKDDIGEVATQAGLGATLGAVAPLAIRGVGKGVKKIGTGVADFMQDTEAELARMAGGGMPTQESLHVNKFQEDVNKIVSKVGDINEQEYSMMDISNRDLTRIQRAKNTIETINTDEEAHLLVSDFNEFMDNYADQFKYAKIKPIEKGDKVKIFRSATGDIEAGDWVGLDKEYAKSHSRTKEHKLYEMWVDKKDIRWQGDDANEWIYLPKELINADIKYAPNKGIQ